MAVWVRNEGPSSAELALTYTLPVGWTVVSYVAANPGTCSGVGTGALISDPLYLGGSAICAPIWLEQTITLKVAVPLAAPHGSYVNTAGISSDNCLNDLGTVSAFQFTEVGLFVDGFESGNVSVWSFSFP